MKRQAFVVFWAVALLVTLSCPTSAQNSMPSAWKPAVEKINQASVTKTIRFLASDDMKGRDTPSPELTKASEYVAERFKKAGLTGLGPDSFFQTTEIATTAVPNQGIKCVVGGVDVKHFGMLNADSSLLEFKGKVKLLSGNEPRNATYTGPVSLVVDPFNGPRDESNFNRKVARLRRSGATAVLVQVDENHALVGAAKRATRQKLVRTRGGAAGHVLVMPKMDLKQVVELELPAQIGGKAEVRNVIGVLRGADEALANEAIIISAHLDHIGQRGLVGDTICNGADDNATGVTAVLTLADAFGSLESRPKRSVIFMTFWGEEKGLLGSFHYVKNPLWPLEKTVCNVNIEMIGRPEPGANEKAWGTGWNYSDLGPILNSGAQKLGVLIFQHPQFSGDMLYRASDNWPFAEKGVVAHSFSAGSLHGDYHQVSDEVEKLELKHMTRVIQGLFGGCMEIASGRSTPKKN